MDRLPTLQLHLRHHQWFLHSTHLSRPCWVSSDTGHCCLRPFWGRHAYKSLPEVGPTRLLAAMLGDLGVSTCRMIKTMIQFFFSFLEHQTSHVVCFNAQGLLYECVFNALLFPRRTDLLGNPFLITLLLDLLFLLSFFGPSYRPSCPPRCSNTTLWVHLWCPLNFFIVVSIYWMPASYRSSLDLSLFGKTTNRSAAKLICSFFWIDVHAILPVSNSTTSSWPSKVAAHTPRSGVCETWVPLGPHRPGSRPSPTRGSGLLEDLPTC
jgi:hypothetical protein